MEEQSHSDHCCVIMSVHCAASSDTALVYNTRFREYGIRILDGGTSLMHLKYCPWCGTQLPASLRNDWFDELERRGLSYPENEIPLDMQDSTWWQPGDPE